MKSIKMAGYLIINTVALVSFSSITSTSTASTIDEASRKNINLFLNSITTQDPIAQKQVLDQAWNIISSMQKTGGRVPTSMQIGLDNSITNNTARKLIDSIGAQIRTLKEDTLITAYLTKIHEALYAPIASKEKPPLSNSLLI